jgi:O-antigen/teichoic acid export membrane protein
MKKIIYIVVAFVGAGVAACYAQPAAEKNSDLILIVVTVFAIFAGFLIAIISVIGDPVMIKEGSWRVSELGRDRMEGRLLWHIALFCLYLVTIGLLFVGVVLEKTLADGSLWKLWIERFYLFFGISSFLLTFLLPASLVEMQRARYDAETQRRRRAAGITDD